MSCKNESPKKYLLLLLVLALAVEHGDWGGRSNWEPLVGVARLMRFTCPTLRPRSSSSPSPASSSAWMSS